MKFDMGTRVPDISFTLPWHVGKIACVTKVETYHFSVKTQSS